MTTFQHFNNFLMQLRVTTHPFVAIFLRVFGLINKNTDNK